MPTPGARRHRDAHSGDELQTRHAPLLAGGHAPLNGVGCRPEFRRPHDLAIFPPIWVKPTGLEDYIGWLANNFDPSISGKIPGVIREFLGRP